MNQVKFVEDHINSDFLKAVFHKFYLVHSWIHCPILNMQYNSVGTNICLNHFRPMFHFTSPENTRKPLVLSGHLMENIGQLWVKVDCLFK